MSKYKIISGTYHVKGYSPDGDSIRFVADDKSNWNFFDWNKPNKKKQKKKQLRLEAIDALETHYEGFRQPGAFAIAALEELLGMLNIKIMNYNLSLTKIRAADDIKPGFIASSKLDMYDRPVAFLFDDSENLADGQELEANKLPVKKSINYKLTQQGLVYPTFYEGLDDDIMKMFRSCSMSARRRSKGIWAIDRTMGFVLWDTRTIQEDVIILPKLFRRLVKFFINRSDMSEFKSYLKKNKDKLKIRNHQKIYSMHDIVSQNGQQISFTERPENIVFIPK